MKTSTIKIALIALTLLLCIGVNAQVESKLWIAVSSNNIVTQEKRQRDVMPLKYQLFKLNSSSFKNLIEQSPSRNLNRVSNVIIELPVAEGVKQRFRVQEASVFESALQIQFPSIRSYVAQGIDDPTAIARFSVSPAGVNVMISSVNYKTVFIEPFTKNLENYIMYSKNDVPVNREFKCMVENSDSKFISENDIDQFQNPNDGKLRTFRLALACTGEYAQFHLNEQGVDPSATDAVKKMAVLAAMNDSMTRVNGVFERDLALTMVIVSNNTDIIFLDGSSDPYTNNDGFAMLGENQNTIDSTIGSANYDIGHVFSTGGGGVAALNSPCSGNKAEGVTGSGFPASDTFDIDYVAHEMGHQYGGNHTQNNSCQRSNASVEPGSASTIMGYAGICSPNVQNNSDDYFHAINIAEMWQNITNGTSTCAVQSDTNNDPPTADAGNDFTIPVSTPFILRGSGTDPNSSNALSYCWEQMDNLPAPMPPSSTSTVGPAFRSLLPEASSDRYMPALATVITGQTASTWEVVPSVARTMNFRLTVRDNVAGGASSASDNTVVTVDRASGPFLVTSQNTNVTWETGTTQTVTWDVANTDVAPVNSANVNILLSVDGGLTFSQVLVSETANDGSENITVPSVSPTIQARIMVAGSNHIYYNVNSSNFTIEGGLGTEEIGFEDFALWPNPSNGDFNISFTPDLDQDISITIYDLQGRRIHQENYKKGYNNSSFQGTFSLNAAETGMYLLTVANGEKMITKRIVKN